MRNQNDFFLLIFTFDAETETGKKGGEYKIPSSHSFCTIDYFVLNSITTELFMSYASSVETPLFLNEP
jgi:hypothetical protein